MKSRWLFRCYPTPEQEDHLEKTFGCVRFAWNWALRMRTDALRDGVRINYPATDAAFTALKATEGHEWLNDVSSVCLQQAIRDLQTAFANFFAKRAAYPRFKRKSERRSANYSERGFSFDLENRVLRLAKIGAIRVKWSRPEIPKPSSVRVIKTRSGRYFVSLVVDVEAVEAPRTGEHIGVDFGVARLATLSNGEVITNPKHGGALRKKLAFCQRRIARKVKGSNHRAKAVQRAARVYEQIANRRKDTLHKMSTNLVSRFDVICVEDLNIRGMVKNHNLARAVQDTAIRMAIRMIEEKAERFGKKVVKIDRWFPSSKTCSACGVVHGDLTLGTREWKCQGCGAVHDRDLNAARNILAVGQTVSVHGGSVRRTTGKPVARKAQRSVNR